MSQVTNSRYLITGSMGCIGSWILYHLVKDGQSLVSFDLSSDRHRLDLLLEPELQEKITFVRGDLTDADQVRRVIRQHDVTHIIHLAALQVPFCRADPALGAQVNVTGTVNIFEAAAEAGINHLAYASSVAVYGPAKDYPPGPVANDAYLNPTSLYGVYKRANEGTARIYWQDREVSSTALRPYTVYGLGRDQGLTSDPTKAMVAAVAGERFHINFGGRMQFQWASDVARQFIDAATYPDEGAHVFSLGTPATSVADFVAAIERFRPGAQITFAQEPLDLPQELDGSALHAHAEHIYETPLEEGIRQTMIAIEERLADGRLAVASK